MTLKTKLDDLERKAALLEVRGKTLDVVERIRLKQGEAGIRHLLDELAERAAKLPHR